MPTTWSNGDSDIISYHLQWDKANGGSSWFDVFGLSPTSLLTGTIQTVDIQGGQTYQYRVRARNIHGWGDFSDPFAIKAAEIPA